MAPGLAKADHKEPVEDFGFFFSGFFFFGAEDFDCAAAFRESVLVVFLPVDLFDTT